MGVAVAAGAAPDGTRPAPEPCFADASADDAEGEPRGAAAVHQLGDLMPVDVVCGRVGQRPRDAETLELCHPPLVHEDVVVVDGLVAVRPPAAVLPSFPL